jgi:hypothetical protein
MIVLTNPPKINDAPKSMPGTLGLGSLIDIPINFTIVCDFQRSRKKIMVEYGMVCYDLIWHI